MSLFLISNQSLKVCKIKRLSVQTRNYKQFQKICFRRLVLVLKAFASVLQIGVLKIFTNCTGTYMCQSLFYKKKETLAHEFSCEFCEKILRTSILQSTTDGCICTFERNFHKILKLEKFGFAFVLGRTINHQHLVSTKRSDIKGLI